MSRPKGYADWSPAPETQAVVRAVNEVLAEYRDHLPLTVRQIFYRLVGQYGYEKTERAYSRLAEYLVRARRAQLIPFSAIRDDGTVGVGYTGFDHPGEWLAAVKAEAEGYTRDRSRGQPVAVELWCEAAGMVPQLKRAAGGYPVGVFSTGGFSSVTVTYEIAQRALAQAVPTVFLHVGDYDPSGVGIYEAMGTDALTFLRQRLYERTSDEQVLYLDREAPDDGPDLRLRRVALTEAQVHEYDLPTAPPKHSDSRSARWVGETCQAEALPPDLLADIVRSAVEAELDMGAYEEALELEAEERAQLIEALEGVEL